VNNRTILFIFTSTTIMMVAMLLQNAYGPKPADDLPPADAIGAVASLDPETQNEDGAENAAAESQADADLETDTDTEAPSEPAAELNLVAGEDPAADAEPEAADEQSKQSTESFLTLGSVSPDGADRFLITINPMGGTIRRVELNFRNQKNDRIVYRDLTNKSGYLGHLEPIESADGLRVRVVGPGTPAALATCKSANEAGVRVNDILLSINGEPITSAADMEKMLAETHPGDSLQLAVKRSGKTVTQD